MSVKDTTLISALIAKGFTPAQALAIADGESPKAASPAVAPAKTAPETPAWIVQFAQNKAARRALAADLRAKGVEPKGAAWAKAKKAAKIA